MHARSETRLDWVKSSRSIGTGACVEFASTGDLIMLRDSKNPGVHLVLTRSQIDAFLFGAKNGEFDHLIES